MHNEKTNFSDVINANAFNGYFINIAADLGNAMFPFKCPNSMFLTPVGKNEIGNRITNVSNSTSKDISEIRIKLLREGPIEHLTIIINTRLEFGQFTNATFASDFHT